MKKLLAMVFSITLSVALLTPVAFAWESHPVDMDKVGVDVGASEWAVDELKAAGEAGLIPSLTGNPGFQDAITREQFAELALCLVKAIYGKDADMEKAKSFTDCDNPAVLEASAFGIVDGLGDGKFAPTQTTNREQIAVMVSRSIDCLNDLNNKNVAPNPPDLEKFTDKEQVSPWAVDGVGVLAANGIMSGTSATVLSPQNSCTVEQSILLFYRVYQQFTA